MIGRQTRSLALALGDLMLFPAAFISGCKEKSDQPAMGPGGAGPPGMGPGGGGPGGKGKGKWGGRPTVPDEFVSLENPVEPGDDATAAGKELYDQHCIGCHGAEGKGDGPKVAELPRPPRDFAHERAASSKPDGEVFWRISEKVGRNMPDYSEKMTETERWQVVHYVRALAPPAEPDE